MGECIMTSARGGSGTSKDENIPVLPNATSFLVTLKGGNCLIPNWPVNITYSNNTKTDWGGNRTTVYNLNYNTNSRAKALFMIPADARKVTIYSPNEINGRRYIDCDNGMVLNDKYKPNPYEQPGKRYIYKNITNLMNNGNIVNFDYVLNKNTQNQYVDQNINIVFAYSNQVDIHVIGGGGGGSGAMRNSDDYNSSYAGSGGGGGAMNVLRNFIPVKGKNYNCFMGPGGKGGYSTTHSYPRSGDAGGSTSFDGLIYAIGGEGGKPDMNKTGETGGKGGIGDYNGGDGVSYYNDLGYGKSAQYRLKPGNYILDNNGNAQYQSRVILGMDSTAPNFNIIGAGGGNVNRSYSGGRAATAWRCCGGDYSWFTEQSGADNGGNGGDGLILIANIR